MQHVIAVSRDDQIIHRQAHSMREISRINIAKVTRRHREVDRLVRTAQREGRVKIVDDLSHDACPVDRIDRNQRSSVRKKCVGNKAGFHQRLAIIKIAPNSDIVDVVSRDSRHLAALHV